MRVHLVTAILSAILVLSGSYSSDAQKYSQTPITISKEKVKNGDGKIYYCHTVLERQTLYSIAKAYGVTADEICDANPELLIRDNGLKKGSVIFIPYKGEITQPKEEDNAATSAEAASVQENQQTSTAQKTEEYTVHVVKWYEDIYDLARKYSVSADAIKEYNGLSSYKLKARQKVRIPLNYKPSQKETAAPAQKEEVKEEESQVTVAESKTEEKSIFGIKLKDKVNAVLILPFGASSQADAGYMDFYSGALLAVEDVRKEGTDIDLRVYDDAGSSMPVTSERLASTDIVIGPVKSAQMEKLLALAPEKTVAVSPLDQTTAKLVPDHKNLIQAPASLESQYRDLVNWLGSERAAGDNVIVLSEKNAAATSSTTLMNSIIAESGLAVKTYSYTILEGRNAVNHITGMLTSEKANRVIINSENEAFVNDAVRNLSMMVYRKYNVILYSPSKIRSYGTIDVENLHDLCTRVSTPYYIDYDSGKVTDFLMRYRALFGTEPTQFAFQGYDIAYYMLKMKSGYGKNWLEKIGSDDVHLMQTDFKFRRPASESGFLNYGIRRVVYGADLTISLKN
jgi:LysM repeat protein